MSDETKSGKGWSIRFNVQGDQHSFLAPDGETMEGLTESARKHAEQVAEHVVDLKQVFTSKAVAAGPPAATPVPTQAAVAPGNVPVCPHSDNYPVKDLLGQRNKKQQLYQWRYYCGAPYGAPDKCEPEKIPGNVKQG